MEYAVVIPSGSALNLRQCLKTLRELNPLPPDRVFIVTDFPVSDECDDFIWIAGEKPFNYSRNLNQGARLALNRANIIILLQDDAILLTPGGFDALVEDTIEHEIGYCSAEIRGVTSNQNLKERGGSFRFDKEMIPSICACLPATTFRTVGYFNERFTGYGREDVDFSRRAMFAGVRLGVSTRCVVDHGSIPSLWRSRDVSESWGYNRQVFKEIWGE